MLRKKTKITKQNENKKQSQSLGVLEQAYVTQARRKLKCLITAFFSQRPTGEVQMKKLYKDYWGQITVLFLFGLSLSKFTETLKMYS